MRTAALPLILLALLLPGVQAASPSFPELGIAISPGEVFLNASPYYQEVSFNGTATMDNPSQNLVQVSLFARGTGGWAGQCMPDTFDIRGSGAMPFNLVIRVNMGASNLTALVWVEGESRFNGAITSTNQSGRATIKIGDLPGYTVSTNREGPWLTSTFGGNVPFSPMMVLLTVMVLVVAGVTYGLVRRRRKRKVSPP